MPNPECHDAITALIAEHGLHAVYTDVREREGYCSNCGCPLLEGEAHAPGGIGMCYIDVQAR